MDVQTDALADGIGYGRDEGPESQGATAGQGFGRNRQGAFGDEDYDPSYERSMKSASADELDPLEQIADQESGEDPADSVTNDDRDVATGDLAALQEVGRKSSWTGDSEPQDPQGLRPDDRIRDDILEITTEMGEDDVGVEVTNGEVLLLGSVATDEQRDLIDERVQELPGIRVIVNEIKVRDDEA